MSFSKLVAVETPDEAEKCGDKTGLVVDNVPRLSLTVADPIAWPPFCSGADGMVSDMNPLSRRVYRHSSWRTTHLEHGVPSSGHLIRR
jgi:hypothetical protein